jgi:CRP-like cAMP-binding protein
MKNIPDINIQLEMRKSHLFSAFDEKQFQLILAYTCIKKLETAEVLFSQGEEFKQIFLLISGNIKLTKITANGQEKIFTIFNAGESFAEAIMLMGKKTYPISAVALNSVTIVAIDAVHYKQMLSESIDVCFQLMAAMSQKMHWLINEVNRLSLHDATFRLVTFLLDKKPKTSNIIYCQVPKNVIASRLSIKPETLSRILKKLSDKKLIKTNNNFIEILDVEQLKNIIF